MGNKKIFIIFSTLMLTCIAYAVDENFYMGGQPYDNFGSSYYPKYTNDYYWGGDGWIFKTGYKVPTDHCCKRVKCTRPCTRLRSSRGASAAVSGVVRIKKSLPNEPLIYSEPFCESRKNNCCNGACRP